MSKKKPVHPLVKERLGYDQSTSDADFLKDWKSRSSQVCKPCWELKYCPYGPFVEQSPLLPPLRSESLEHHNYIIGCLESGMIGEFGPLSENNRVAYERLLALNDEDPVSFARYVARHHANETAFFKAEVNEQSVEDVLGVGPLPPIHKYRAPFPFQKEADCEGEFDITSELQIEIDRELTSIQKALNSGLHDRRKPLDATRRAWFEKTASTFDAEALPNEIPDVVSDMACNIFGHICPVVFVGENISETSEERRRGRYIPFHVKMRVVRRDNHTCQECGKHLRDDEVEFDHIIPHAKGGSAEEHNIRLTCFGCNRDKSDSVVL